MATRPAGKAGIWYDDDADDLAAQLDRNLAGVDANKIGCDSLPLPGARVIIAPHAGYDYSGECAAWAYGCLDLTSVARVFIIGPSHAIYLASCAVTTYAHFDTPFGPLDVDVDVVKKLHEENGVPYMDRRADSKEHSLELQLPYLYKRIEQTLASQSAGPRPFPKIVPIVVGDLDGDEEKEMGAVLEPYLADAQNAFIVSSDFCHWGDRFEYTVYSPTKDVNDLQKLENLQGGVPSSGPSAEDTIELVDMHALEAIKSGKHDNFLQSMRLTCNTVCGRHPIGVVMAALEVRMHKADDQSGRRFRFRETMYTTSGRVKDDDPISDHLGHSVSYLSAYALA